MAYGVVEFNHMIAQKTGQIKAQLPASSALKTVVGNKLENGMVLVYDEVVGEVRLPVATDTPSDLMLHKSAEKLYDKFHNALGDFALDLTGGVFPRMYALVSGSTYTMTLENVVFGSDFASASAGDLLYVDVDNGTGKITDVIGTDNIAFAKIAKKTVAPNGVDDAIKVVVL